MNNNTSIIARYLQNEMSDAERIAFELQLATDNTLKEELRAQQLIMQAAVNAGIKTEFEYAFRKRLFLKKTIRWIAFVAVAVITVTVFLLLKKSDIEKRQVQTPTTQTSNPFIISPVPQADVPFNSYQIVAETGDTILHKSGTVLYFPPSAFVNEASELIKGEVTIQYREFKKPVDFFVSGIPMRYDSAGSSYIFESSGMCEIMAYQEGRRLLVNTSAQPVVLLSSENENPLHNLYYLDTINRKWEYVGKDLITKVQEPKKSEPKRINFLPPEKTDEMVIIKPVMPSKRNEEKQAFSIEIEPGSFEELFAYDKLKFEVLDESTYKRSDANEHWDNVILERTKASGIYNISFSNSNRKVTYKVRPVLEGADYISALNEFKIKEKEYEKLLKERKQNEQKQKDSLETLLKKHEQSIATAKRINDSINELIQWRNQQLANMQSDTLQIGITSQIMRSFSINKFGIWNCDHPLFPNMQIPITADFRNESGERILFRYAAVVYKDFNGLMQFYPPTIRVLPGKQNMIWAILENQFYYFSYADFTKAAITGNTDLFVFNMRKASTPVNSYEDIKALTEQLPQ